MPELIAYHEAGHALIAILLGAQVKQVTIDPDNDDGPERQGDTQIRWRRSSSEKEFAQNVVQVSLESTHGMGYLLNMILIGLHIILFYLMISHCTV